MQHGNPDLKAEAKRATKMLKGKVVLTVWRHTERQVGIEFTDGTRLFVDHQPSGVELSITL